MKNFLQKLFTVIIIIVASAYLCPDSVGQSIQLVPNPDAGGVSLQIPFAYSNNVYVRYTSETGVTRLAKYDGASLTLIPYPDAGTLVATSGMTVFNNKLYFNYRDASHVEKLASYDGSSITLFTYPAGVGSVRTDSLGFSSIIIDSSIAYNNKLYFKNRGLSGVHQLLQFDGTSITLLPNPDAGVGYLNMTNRFVYNNKLYINYSNAAGKYQLVQYNGLSWTLVPNPDAGKVEENSQPVVYRNAVFFGYTNAANIRQLAQFNGTGIVLVPNPGLNTVPDVYRPVVFNDKLYTTYSTPDSGYKSLVGEFNGSSTRILPPPDVSRFGSNGADSGIGFNSDFVEYKGRIYSSFYVGFSTIRDIFLYMTEFDGTRFSLTSVNSTNSQGGWAIVPLAATNDKLIVSDIRRVGIYNRRELGVYDGNTFTFIPPPNEGDLTTRGLVLNNRFYFIYASPPAFGSTQYSSNLAYIQETTLPVGILNFAGRLQHDKVVLQWQTASEQNSDHFTIQRSKDGINYAEISEVKAAGNSTAIRSYNFTDNDIIKPGFLKLFYRLKEVDKDGREQLSAVVTIDIPERKDHFAVYPSPAKNLINIDLPYALSPDAMITLTDIHGRKVRQQKPQANNLHQQVEVSKMQSGVYTITIMDNGKNVFSRQITIIE